MKRKNNEIKAVFRFSDPYEKLDYIENNINDIIPVIEKTDIEYRDIIIQKLQRIQAILDRHHGLLLYARKNHGFDLDKILDQWYYDREYKKEEIKKAYK
jgi:hypothetical protein